MLKDTKKAISKIKPTKKKKIASTLPVRMKSLVKESEPVYHLNKTLFGDLESRTIFM